MLGWAAALGLAAASFSSCLPRNGWRAVLEERVSWAGDGAGGRQEEVLMLGGDALCPAAR